VGWWCVRVRSWHQYGGARRPRRSRFSPQSTAFEVWLGDTVATQIRPWCNRRVTGSDCLYRTTAGAHPRREAVSNRWLHPVQARGSSGCRGRQGHPCFCAPGEARTSAPIRGNVGNPSQRLDTSRVPNTAPQVHHQSNPGRGRRPHRSRMAADASRELNRLSIPGARGRRRAQAAGAQSMTER
jgi:hypothetical protein